MNGVPTIIPQTAAPGTSLAWFLSSGGTVSRSPPQSKAERKFKDEILLSPGEWYQTFDKKWIFENTSRSVTLDG
jgi:hypothetical protein